MTRLAQALLTLARYEGENGLVYLTGSDLDAERLARLARVALPGKTVLLCPASDALPGDAVAASPANAGVRVAALHRLHQLHGAGEGAGVILIAGAEASVAAYPPPGAFADTPPHLSLGEAVCLTDLHERLLELGYTADERVDEPGEVGVPGAVMDVFPVDADQPVRIEVENGQVSALRRFDPVSQMTVDTLGEARFGRASEPPVGPEPVDLLAHHPGALLVIEDDFARQRRRYAKLRQEWDTPGAVAPITEARWKAAAEGRQTLALPGLEAVPAFAAQDDPLGAFAAFRAEQLAAGRRVLIAGGARDCRFLARLIAREDGAEPVVYDDLAEACAGTESLALVRLPLDEGGVADTLALVAAADLLGSRAERADAAEGTIAADPLAIQLRLGDAVVHEDHGVGILEGLSALQVADMGEGEAIELRYAKDARRQVPIQEAHKLWRYGGEPDAVTLDTLDGKSWARKREGIDEAIAQVARHMAELAARRAETEAPVLEAETAAYETFSEGFPFAETADQYRAIEAVRRDLASGRPMDRLVVGDVGFGKTEVALRAAAIAVLAGKQVALVAPTTILARQHFELFTKRFAALGIEPALLTAALPAAEAKAVKAGLADGSVRLAIGTSSLAGKGVSFADLGLVIIDEEQRFGVADKRKLEEMGAGHVLRLSATPIPRTLQAAMIGLMDLSVIATPPSRRVPVRSILGDFDAETVKAALVREKARRGQSFVVVPRIADLEPVGELLAKLVPDLSVIPLHGKMKAAEIEDALLTFAQGGGDVLLATSIIETGLDMPRANTICIVGVEGFGIGQLHQLRGRVGRGARRGQALFLSAPGAELADGTRTRLAQLVAQAQLGAGFAVAANDLDQRGAGALDSEEQSGHMALIGMEFYQHLLEAILRDLRGESPQPPVPRIETGQLAGFPDDWIVDPEARIAAYIRLARLGADGDIDVFAEELEDRYGALPPPALELLAQRRIAVQAQGAGVTRITVGPKAIALTTPVEPKAMPDGWERKAERLIVPRQGSEGELEEALAALGGKARRR